MQSPRSEVVYRDPEYLTTEWEEEKRHFERKRKLEQDSVLKAEKKPKLMAQPKAKATIIEGGLDYKALKDLSAMKARCKKLIKDIEICKCYIHREEIKAYVPKVYADRTNSNEAKLRDIFSQVELLLESKIGDIEDLKKEYSEMKIIAAETVKKVHDFIKPAMKTFEKETVDNIKAAVATAEG